MVYGALSAFKLQWRYNGHDGVSNHQPHGYLLNRSFRPRSKQTSKLRVTGLCMGNSPVTGEFPAQMASNAENVSIWWRHHVSACDVWDLHLREDITSLKQVQGRAALFTTANSDLEAVSPR